MKKLVLVLGIVSMLVSCSNEEAQKVEAQKQIDSINLCLDYKLKLIDLGGYGSIEHKSYIADSLGLSVEEKEAFIKK
jgi:hypothetical protein